MSYNLPQHCPHRPVSITNNHPRSHNLNIQSYSLEELLGIFELPYDMSVEDLKRAKKKVLMVHPDKSRLPPDYFLFYKKAYEIILDLYKTNARQNQSVPTTPMEYEPIHVTNKQTTQQIRGIAKEIDEKQFADNFNKLFNEYMYKKPDETRNQWFTEETPPAYQYNGPVSSSNMSNAFQDIKRQHQQNMLAHYRGVSELTSTRGGAASCYDDDDEDGNGEYISSDPFGKLKFEDLRKVHKDQTIFAVSERDIERVQQYGSVDEYSRAREAKDMTPMSKQMAEREFDMREKERQVLMMKKQHQNQMRIAENEKKNDLVRARFLQLADGGAKPPYGLPPP